MKDMPSIEGAVQIMDQQMTRYISQATGCSLNIVFFLVVISLNSASSAAAPVFDLPLRKLTDTGGKPREARVRN